MEGNILMNLKVARNVSRLFSKSVGNTIEGGARLQGANKLSVVAPTNASTYDLIDGIGQKGKFSLYSFKDKDGNTIQHYTRYLEDDGKITDVVTDFDNSIGSYNVTRKIVDAGHLKPDGSIELKDTVKEVQYSSIIPQINPKDNTQLLYTKSYMTMSPNGDFGGLELLQKGQKPSGASYKYHWDGSPAEINYKNTAGKKLDLTEEEYQYLPLVSRKYIIIEQNGQPTLMTLDFTTERVNEKIGLIQLIQEKLHNIEGIMPRAKGVKTEDLHVVKTSGMTPEQWQATKGFAPNGENLGNGQINIAVDVPTNTDGAILLDLISHEMQHAADFIKMYRGGAEASNEALKRVGMTLKEYEQKHSAASAGIDAKSYMDKIIEKLGAAKKGTPEYDEAVDLYEMNFKTVAAKDLKSVEEHDIMELEKRAKKREYQQMEFFNQICAKFGNFLSQFIK